MERLAVRWFSNSWDFISRLIAGTGGLKERDHLFEILEKRHLTGVDDLGMSTDAPLDEGSWH